jgi:hypothetical protein
MTTEGVSSVGLAQEDRLGCPSFRRKPESSAFTALTPRLDAGFRRHDDTVGARGEEARQVLTSRRKE